MAPARSLTAHEEGHRRIAEQIYGDAERIARTVGRGLDGKKIVATAADCGAADKKATESSAHQFCEGYLKQTFDVTRQVGDAYDDLTAHGTLRRAGRGRSHSAGLSENHWERPPELSRAPGRQQRSLIARTA